MPPDFGAGCVFSSRGPHPDPPGRVGAASVRGSCAASAAGVPQCVTPFKPGRATPCPSASRRWVTQAAIRDRELNPSLRRMFSTCPWAVRTEMTSRAAISGLDSPSATRSATSSSRLVSGDGSHGRGRWIRVGLRLEGEPDRVVQAELGPSAEQLAEPLLAQQRACLLEAVGPGRRERERVAGLRHADDVPDALGGTQQQRCPLTSALRGRDASQGVQRDRHAHPVTQLLLQDDGLTEQRSGLLEVATGQLLLTQPGHRQRLHVALADLVCAGDALLMPGGRLHPVAGEAVADARDEQRQQLAGQVGGGPQQRHRSVGLIRSRRRGAVPDREHRGRHHQQPERAGVVDGGGHLVALVDQLLGPEPVVLEDREPGRHGQREGSLLRRPGARGQPESPASGVPRRAIRRRTSTGRASSP